MARKKDRERQKEIYGFVSNYYHLKRKTNRIENYNCANCSANCNRQRRHKNNESFAIEKKKFRKFAELRRNDKEMEETKMKLKIIQHDATDWCIR